MLTLEVERRSRRNGPQTEDAGEIQASAGLRRGLLRRRRRGGGPGGCRRRSRLLGSGSGVTTQVSAVIWQRHLVPTFLRG